MSNSTTASTTPSVPPSSPPPDTPSSAPPPSPSTKTVKSTTGTITFTSKTTVPAGGGGGSSNGAGGGGGSTQKSTRTYTRTVVVSGTTSTGTYTGVPASSAAAIDNNGSSNSSGLSTGATTAIAVIIPVAFVALLVGLGIFFWRKRRSKKEEEEVRRRAVEDYNYNPNHDPTLPAIGSDAGGPQMSEDHSSGYRGWGAAASSGRKMSTTLSGGQTQQLSDSGHSDPMMNGHRDTVGSDDMNALGVAPVGMAKTGGLRRGPSNASSTYSAGDDLDDHEVPPMPDDTRYELPGAYNHGYGQTSPYGEGAYGQPVVQTGAQRSAQYSHGGGYGNSGIAQNF